MDAIADGGAEDQITFHGIAFLLKRLELFAD
jgi:hypothetical protein